MDCSPFVPVIVLCYFELQLRMQNIFSQIKLDLFIYSYFLTHFIGANVSYRKQLKRVNLLQA